MQPNKRPIGQARSFSVRPVRKSLRSRLPNLLPKNKSFRYLAIYVGMTLLSFGFLALAAVYFIFLHSLPSIETIEQDVLPESTVIYDRNGGELYKLYDEEKRTYVAYAGISDSMKNAIIAAEDKTFFENQGIDLRGLVRSGVNFAFGKTDKIQGTSTISQQLIKNTFLSNERSVERKVKEIYLSYRLNSKYSKEKILELYLNKISFGNNAYGVEEAAKTYFGKSAKDVGVLGSTILASLPKGPTYYSPFSHRDRLMGYLYVYATGDEADKIFVDTPEKMKEYSALVETFKKTVASLDIKRKNSEDAEVCGLSQDSLKKDYNVGSDGCADIQYKDFLGLLNDIRISSGTGSVALPEAEKPLTSTGKTAVGKPSATAGRTSTGAVKPATGTGKVSTGPIAGQKLYLEYSTGRKDFVAGRLLEDDKITPDEYKNVIIGGLDFQFRKYSENIKYPHFVFYVKDYLEQKYGKDFESQGGLKIYTTIDPVLQDKAEALVKKQVAVNKDKYGANSAALVSLDNKTGQILSMVGGPDYFDEANGGNVNMVTARRQPGSSFKPIVYALAISKEAISPDTPIYDVDTKFGKWEPDNYDQKFMGKMKVKTALDYSRNIPAIKMFWVAGGESDVVKFARSLGILSLQEGANYGAPLAIGTGEVKPLEMLSAYSVFANAGWKKEIVPILRIEDRKGNVIDRYVESNGKYVFSDAASYVLSSIISDAKSRPSDFWNNVLTLKDRPVAAKTGTSNKDVSVGKEKKILPRDLWTAGYTPQITTVVWAGNVDGTETKGTCDGLNCAAPIWHDYMEFAHRNLPKEQFKKPDSVYSATISTISGKLASENTPEGYRVTSIFAVKPTAYENSMKEMEVDSLCNGKVTENTPADAVKKGYLINVNPIIDSYDTEWLGSIKSWVKSEAGSAYFAEAKGTIITDYQDQVCERPGESASRISVSTNLAEVGVRPVGANSIEVGYEADNPIVKLKFLRDGELFKEIAIEGDKVSGTYKNGAFDFDDSFVGEHTLDVVAVDKYGYSGKTSTTVMFSKGDNQDPVISVTNPSDSSVKIYVDQFFNLRFDVTDANEIVANNLVLDGKLWKILGNGNSFTVAINEEKNLPVGPHVLTIESTDARRGKAKHDVNFEVLAK